MASPAEAPDWFSRRGCSPRGREWPRAARVLCPFAGVVPGPRKSARNGEKRWILRWWPQRDSCAGGTPRLPDPRPCLPINPLLVARAGYAEYYTAPETHWI